MDSILKYHIEKRNFHHGYLLVGDLETSRKMALEAAQVILIPTPGVGETDPRGRLRAHPDFFYQKFELFDIEESRILKGKASKRPFLGDKKVFVIELFSFSLESANALLKTLEEPYPGTHFFVIVPSLENVIPTLISRLTIINNSKIKKELSEEKIKFYKKFLADLPHKRLETIKNFSKDPLRSEARRQEAIEFLNELELVIVSQKKLLSLKTGTKGNLTENHFFLALSQIQKCRSFLFSQGSSPKMVLEHIALALPMI